MKKSIFFSQPSSELIILVQDGNARDFSFEEIPSEEIRVMSIRFLIHYGPNVAECDPLPVKIISLEQFEVDEPQLNNNTSIEDIELDQSQVDNDTSAKIITLQQPEVSRHNISIIYEVDNETYQVSAKFNYHPVPDNDFFTDVTDLETYDLPGSQVSLK